MDFSLTEASLDLQLDAATAATAPIGTAMPAPFPPATPITTFPTATTRTLAEFLESRLGRPLDSVESHVLAHLSAEGAAKINSDALSDSGANLEETLMELKVAYRKSKQRRRSLEAKLSAEALAVLRSMDRKPTTDELALFASLPFEWLQMAIQKHLQEQDQSLTNAIEDLASQHKFAQLRIDAKALADRHQLPFAVAPLCPCQCPNSLDPVSPTVTRIASHRLLVGMSPIACWFHDSPVEMFRGLRIPSPPPGGCTSLASPLSDDGTSSTCSGSSNGGWMACSHPNPSSSCSTPAPAAAIALMMDPVVPLTPTGSMTRPLPLDRARSDSLSSVGTTASTSTSTTTTNATFPHLSSSASASVVIVQHDEIANGPPAFVPLTSSSSISESANPASPHPIPVLRRRVSFHLPPPPRPSPPTSSISEVETVPPEADSKAPPSAQKIGAAPIPTMVDRKGWDASTSAHIDSTNGYDCDGGC